MSRALHGHFGMVLLILAFLAAATPARGQQTVPSPGPGQTESDPIKCWWKTDKSAIRIGEPFAITLTCGVIETSQVRVVADQNNLDPGAIELAPFEVVGGRRHRDVEAPPWRYFQYSYNLRLLDDEFFGKELTVPGIQLAYSIQTSGGGGAQGRPQPYFLPALSLRVLSIVPLSANDIMDASNETFADMESRDARASVELAAAWLLFAFAVVLAGVGVIRSLGRYRARVPVATHVLPTGSVLRGCIQEADRLKAAVVGTGWTPELVGRALAVARIGGAVATGRPVAQARVDLDQPAREGQLALRMGLLRPRHLVVSGAITPADLQQRAGPGGALAPMLPWAVLDDLRESLRAFGEARYSREGRLDRSVLDAALEQSTDVIRRLRSKTRWPARMADALAGMAAGVRGTAWSR